MPSDRKIDGRLADYDQSFLMCRYRRHLWQHVGFYRTRDSGQRYIVSVLECASCTTQREDWIAPGDGGLIGHHYRHPDGFLFKYTEDERAENRRVRAPDVMRQLLKRSDVYESESAFRAGATRERIRTSGARTSRATAKKKFR